MMLTDVGATTITSEIVVVLKAIVQWISSSILSLMPMFYNESGLTVLGTFAVITIAFGAAFGLIELIKSWMHF